MFETESPKDENRKIIMKSQKSRYLEVCCENCGLVGISWSAETEKGECPRCGWKCKVKCEVTITSIKGVG